uniref:Uncharacterized protein n=1 Tax=Anguilla anguilla TaxID=7936 RepID=A0A0E9W653_ANGAN
MKMTFRINFPTCKKLKSGCKLNFSNHI